MYSQIREDYQNAFEKIMQMLKDPRYRKKSEAFLKVYAQHQCEPEEDSAYDESEYSLDENPVWEVPPEEDNQNTEVYGNKFYAPVYADQIANQLSTPCNNYYESLAEDDDMSDDEMDAYDEEMYKEFEDEVEQEDEMLFYPQEPSRMPPGFTKEHTGYNTYQDHCGARSAVNTKYMENFQYQDSPNPHSSGYQQAFQAGSSFPGLPNHRSFPVLPNHQQVSFNLPRNNS